jgi:hypothetical protein
MTADEQAGLFPLTSVIRPVCLYARASATDRSRLAAARTVTAGGSDGQSRVLFAAQNRIDWNFSAALERHASLGSVRASATTERIARLRLRLRLWCAAAVAREQVRAAAAFVWDGWRKQAPSADQLESDAVIDSPGRFFVGDFYKDSAFQRIRKVRSPAHI